jgi:hypothetical protein
MKRLVDGGEALNQQLGSAGRKRVLQNFAFSVFADKLDTIVKTRNEKTSEYLE